MQNISPISKYKNNIAVKILLNNNIVKALVINDKNFLNKSLPNNFDSSTLLYRQIFPYVFSPNIETDVKTYITMSFDNFRYVNNAFKSGIVSFFVFTHNSLIPTEYGLRYDYISHQIDKIFNKKYNVGAFGLEIDGGGDINISDNYFGSMLSYKFTDFQ